MIYDSKNLFYFLVIIPFLFLAGCAPTWSYADVDLVEGVESKKYSQTNVGEIIITPLDITDRKYEVLGDINTTVNKTTVFHDDPTKEQVNAALKEQAAEMGADAVILIRYGDPGLAFMSWGAMEGKGRAVKFID